MNRITFGRKLAVLTLFFIFLCIPPSLAGMSSTNYSIPSLNANNGSGSRNSSNYQIPSDALSQNPIGSSGSAGYNLFGFSIVPSDMVDHFGGVFINNDAEATNSTSVTLDLICGHDDGCDFVVISNNGVGWSDPQPYSTTQPWELIANDGMRNVFVRYQDGLGNWSGICSDSIVLDTTPPVSTISPISGTYMSPPSITLTASEPSDTYYTTDGSDPTTGSDLYSVPITINSDSTLKCFSQDIAGNTGSIQSEEYTVCDGSNLSITGVVRDATVDNRGVPLVIITLNNGQSATTDVDGNYSFAGLSRGYYTIESVTAASPGYVTYQKKLLLCKSSISHDITLTKNAALFGGSTFAGYSKNSVNTGTGNYFYDVADLQIPGRGFSFSFIRSYNSQDRTDGPLGIGWTHTYNISLFEDDNVTVRWGDGKAETWVPDGGGGYTPMEGVFDTLVKNPDDTFTITRKDLIEYHFNESDQLSLVQDENGNTLTFTYSGNELASITDIAGRTVGFSNDAQGRITRILDPMGRSVTFSYDVNGDLISSTNLAGSTIAYTYDDDHRLLTRTDPLGNTVITNVYDEQRDVVVSQRDALGAEYLYTYDVTQKITQIVDPYGNTSYHHFDDLLRLIKEVDALDNFATYVYNDLGSIESVTDKNGNVTTYQYDGRGNVLLKTDPLGNQTSATYDANNNPLTKTDARGNTTTFTYDADGNLLTITDSLNNVTSYTYDEYGQVLTITDARGNATTYEYDQYGNQTAVIDALGDHSTFTFDIVGRKLTETYPLGRATAFEYDDLDNLISVTDALGGISIFTYDANSNKTEHTDANGNKTTFNYDAKNHLIGKTTPLLHTETYTYDLMDRRKSITNPNGANSSLSYDVLGNVIYEIDAKGNQVEHAYDANGNRVYTVDAMGNKTTFGYDANNRLISTTDALGNAVTYTYDENGNRLTLTNALGNTTSYSYDELNRLLTITDPLDNVTSNEYNEIGQLIRVTNAKSNPTSYEYDELGRLVTVTDAGGGVVTATYDAIGNRISVTDTRGNTTSYTYDVLNRLVSETDPLNRTESMSYDAVGNLLSFSNADGTTTYIYDNDNRLNSLTYPDATTVSYTYDANGNRLSVSDIMGTTSYTYTVRDQISSVTDPFGLTVGYTYNSVGNRTSIKYPGNRNVTYHYDLLNRLSSVVDWGGIATSYQYDGAGRLVTKIMGNNAKVYFTYDAANRLISKEDRDPDGGLIASYEITLDEVGNRTSIDMDQPLIPRVDVINDSSTYDEADQIVSNGSATFSHDGKGNRVQMTDGGVTTQYAYNFDNMLTMVTKGAERDEYGYTSDGHRLVSRRGGIETRYLLDLNGSMENVLAEMDEDNQANQYYIYGDGLLYSIDFLTDERLFFHYDFNGNTVAITDSQGTVTYSYAYLPFGDIQMSGEPFQTVFKYGGKYGVMHEPNGLYFMRARYYDPVSRRFLSKDPIVGNLKDTQTLPRYLYVQNNPFRYIDPNGEELATILLFATAAFLINEVIYQYEEPDREKQNWKDRIYGAPRRLWKPAVCVGSAVTGVGGIYAAFGCMINDGLEIGNAAEGDLGSNDKLSRQSFDNNTCSMHNSDYSVNLYSRKNSNDILTHESEKELVGSDNPNDNNSKTEVSYIHVGRYASRHFSQEFKKLKDPYLFSKETRSYIEYRIQSELSSLQKNRYSYTNDEDYLEEKADMMGDIRQSARHLYASLASALSKYNVLVRDLEELPTINSANINRRGVYAN